MGNRQAAEDIRQELRFMAEIASDQGGSKSPAPRQQPQQREQLGEAITTGGTEGVGVVVEGAGGEVGGELCKRLAEAVMIKGLLELNTDEVANLLRALDGSYVKPGVGGRSMVNGVCVCVFFRMFFTCFVENDIFGLMCGVLTGLALASGVIRSLVCSSCHNDVMQW